MTILNIHAGSLPSFALRLKSSDNLSTLRQRAAAKVRLQLSDGIPLAVKYGWNGQKYSLEDEDDWDIFVERVANHPEADGELPARGYPKRFICLLTMHFALSLQSTSLLLKFLPTTMTAIQTQQDTFRHPQQAPLLMYPSSMTPTS